MSQDTQLCLWDITEDVLRQSYGPPHHRTRLSTLEPQTQQNPTKEKEYSQLNGDLSGSGDNIKSLKPTSSSSLKKDVTDSGSLCGNKLNNNDSKLINCTSDISVDNSKNLVNNVSGKAVNNTSVNSSNSNLSNKTISDVNSTEKSNSNHLNNNNHSHSHQHSSAFNTLTQRFTNFSFGSDKNNSKSNKRSFTLSSKSNSSNNSNNNNSVQPQTNNDSSTTSTLRNKSNGSIVTSYDPMKLIGTPACPRFDECPVLEPLVCKKIAHERLTALIFREDCFLTACQDGFIYTWARPVSRISLPSQIEFFL